MAETRSRHAASGCQQRRHDGRVVRLAAPRLAARPGRAASAVARRDRRGHRWRRCCFRSSSGNDADIDSAANALAFAALALGLNIVVGFAGLLDLGYAAFFAIGAYTYGVAASWQIEPAWSELLGAVPVARPRRAVSRGRRRRRAFPGVVLADDADRRRRSRRFSACCSARRPCGSRAITWRS